MSTPIIAASAAAFGLYVYLKQRTAASEGSPEDEQPRHTTSAEAWRHVEHPPNTWTEALYYLKEVCRYMYTETLGRWHTVDLFVGLAYLSQREPLEYPAADIAYRGHLLSQDQSTETLQAQLDELKEVRRHLLYCRGLKYFKEDQQIRFWMEHLQLDPAQVLSQSAKAKVLRPAYVLLADMEIHSIILCIRGTQNYQDLFTSLAATTKPHHKVSANGVVLGYSHLGMLTAARWLMREVARDIRLAMKMHPGYKLRLVGHSMGAGTAALLTTMLRETIPECSEARCYALACPACMTLELATACKDYVTSIVHGTDIVPTFSAASVDALREDVMHSSWFVEFQRDLRTSLFRTVQDGWRGVGSATQWTARNILQPPFRSCYPRSNTASQLQAAGRASVSGGRGSVSDGNLLVSGAGGGGGRGAQRGGAGAEGSSADVASTSSSLAGVTAPRAGASDWPQTRPTHSQRRNSDTGDTWVPACHMGGALSAQQLRRRLWPWGNGSRGREGGWADQGDVGLSYDAAASMSYAGWLPDASSSAYGYGGSGHGSDGGVAEATVSQAVTTVTAGGVDTMVASARLQAVHTSARGGASSSGAGAAAGPGAGAGTSGRGLGDLSDSPSKRKSWNALQGLSRWWSQKVVTTAGAPQLARTRSGGSRSRRDSGSGSGAETASAGVVGRSGAAGSEHLARVSLESGLGLEPGPSQALEPRASSFSGGVPPLPTSTRATLDPSSSHSRPHHNGTLLPLGSAGSRAGSASGAATTGPVADEHDTVPRGTGAGQGARVGRSPAAPPLTAGGGSAAWLRGVFAVCTARRSHAQPRTPGGIVGAAVATPRLPSHGQEGLLREGPGRRDEEEEEDEGESGGYRDDGLGHDDGVAGGLLGGDGLDSELQEREIQEDITAVVAAVTGEGADEEAGEGPSSPRAGSGEEDEDGLVGRATSEERALLREIGDGGASVIALDSMPGGAPLPLSPPPASSAGRGWVGAGAGQSEGQVPHQQQQQQQGQARKARRLSGPRASLGPSPGSGPNAREGGDSSDGGGGIPAVGRPMPTHAGGGAGTGGPAASGAGLGAHAARPGSPGQGLESSLGAEAGQGAFTSGTAATAGGGASSAPKRHLYPPGRVLHMFPAARISGPTGPLPSPYPAPRNPLGSPPVSGVSTAAMAEWITRHTPTPSGIRANAAETASARMAFYETPHVLLEVPDNQAYARIKLCRTMVLDHLMPAYLTALTSVMQQIEDQIVLQQGTGEAGTGVVHEDLHVPGGMAADAQAQAQSAPGGSGLHPPEADAASRASAPRQRSSGDAAPAEAAGLAPSAGSAAPSGVPLAIPQTPLPSITSSTIQSRSAVRQRPIFSTDGELLL